MAHVTLAQRDSPSGSTMNFCRASSTYFAKTATRIVWTSANRSARSWMLEVDSFATGTRTGRRSSGIARSRAEVCQARIPRGERAACHRTGSAPLTFASHPLFASRRIARGDQSAERRCLFHRVLHSELPRHVERGASERFRLCEVSAGAAERRGPLHTRQYCEWP